MMCYKYHVFALDSINVWVYVECSNKYIARMMIYCHYYNDKNIRYVGQYDILSEIQPPDDILVDGYNKEAYINFKSEFSLNF
jgi:hypothetical protein